MLPLCTLLLLLTGLMTSCSDSKSANNEGDKLTLVTTTTYMTDLVKVIGGDKIEVQNLCGPGVDPHTYVATAGDVEDMQKADVLVSIGVGLEAQLAKILDSLKAKGAKVICAGDGMKPEQLLRVDEDGVMVNDPHIWNDVAVWTSVAEHVADKLSVYDPLNKEIYKANLAAYKKQLAELNTYVDHRFKEIPAESRVLITAHDAFGYMARAYGIEVDALQGLSTATEAGTKDVSALADKIAQRKIKAIFIENIASPQTMEALQAAVRAKGAEVKMGGELYSDALGDEASGRDTYLKVIKGNVDTIVDALK